MNPFKGIVSVTSGRGGGKTMFAVTCLYPPQDMIFVSNDSRRPPFADKFHQVHMVRDTMVGKTQIEIYQYYYGIFSAETEAKVIIVDQWREFSLSCHAEVSANPLMYFRSYSAKGTIKGSQIWQQAKKLEADVLEMLKAKYELVILTHQEMEDRKVPGRYYSEISQSADLCSDLHVWLTRHPEPNQPLRRGLVAKNYPKVSLDDAGLIVPLQALPEAIPYCDFSHMAEYYDKVESGTVYSDVETMTPDERKMVFGEMSLSDKAAYVAMTQANAKLYGDEKDTDLAVELQKVIDDNGISGPPKIVAGKLSEILGYSITPSQVKEIL